jgi:hypothetical protein
MTDEDAAGRPGCPALRHARGGHYGESGNVGSIMGMSTNDNGDLTIAVSHLAGAVCCLP